MTFFEDLTPYTYFHSEEEKPDTVNIGWLDRVHGFPTGPTSVAFRDNLQRLCELRVNQTRGFVSCAFCQGPDRPKSSEEMRVSGQGRVYAAPSMVHHYVVVHNYCPPEEFIAAVLAWNADSTSTSTSANA